MSRNLKDYLVIGLKGMAMGAADVKKQNIR